MILDTFIDGEPKAKGSWKALIFWGKEIPRKPFARLIPDDKKSRPWQDLVATMIRQEYTGPILDDCPIKVDMTFYITRGKTITRLLPCKQPDWDKLARCVSDAMEGIVYKNDAQITDGMVRKRYADESADQPPGVRITVFKL